MAQQVYKSTPAPEVKPRAGINKPVVMNYMSPQRLSKDFSREHLEYRQRLDRLLELTLPGWDSVFVRDLDRRWKVCQRDGKNFKLSAKQSKILSRIERGGDR